MQVDFLMSFIEFHSTEEIFFEFRLLITRATLCVVFFILGKSYTKYALFCVELHHLYSLIYLSTSVTSVRTPPSQPSPHVKLSSGQPRCLPTQVVIQDVRQCSILCSNFVSGKETCRDFNLHKVQCSCPSIHG